MAATALTGVVLFGGHQALAQGKAAKIKLSLSGGFLSLLGFGMQKASFEKSSDADVSGITHYEPFNIVNDAEIHVSGSVRLDNGMTVSVVVEFEADQFTANGSAGGQGDSGIDESYISLGGGSYELGASISEVVTASGGNSGTETQSFDIGLGYSAKLGKADISADIQYQRVVGPAASSLRGLRFGVNLSAWAFTVGGGYREIRDTDPGVSGTANSNDQTSWDIGVSYTGSGWAIGLTALGSEMPLTGAALGDDEVAKVLLGLSYDMGPGIELLCTVADVDWQDELTNASNNNVGYAVGF